MQIFRQLIGPERLNDGGQFVQSGGHGAACAGVLVFDTAAVVQDDVAGFATRGIGAGFGELAESLAQGDDGNAPDFGAAHYRGLFARSEVQPEFLDELFAMRVGGPSGSEGREMLRRMRAGVGAGIDDDVGETVEGGADGAGSKR